MKSIRERLMGCAAKGLASAFCFGMVACAALPAAADDGGASHADVPLELSKIFQSNMVIQHDRLVRVWGKGPMGETVTVSFAGQTATSAAIGEDDLWEVAFARSFSANPEGQQLKVRCSDGATITLDDVLVGNVWIAAGQSNMVMPVKGSAYGDTYDADATVADMANHPQIRWMAMDIKYGQASTPEPYEVKGGAWGKAAKNLSAVAYHFAHDCVTAHPEIPVGIIGCYCNALSISYWKPGGTKTLWNCQLAPITRFAVRGAIWYQGETDAWGTQIRDHRHYSTDALEPMVAAWRREFGVEAADFPFYFVQLAGYLNGSTADDPSGDDDLNYRAVRESMFWARRHIENSGMVVAWDCGRLKLEGEDDATCQHPKCKNVLGKRLARLALRNVYGDNIVAESPYWTETVTDGIGNIRVKFDMNGSAGFTTALKNWDDAAWPVKTTGEALKGFAVAGSDKVWHWANAVIESADTIRLSSAEVPQPVYVRYCYRCNPVGGIANGYSEEMLPIAPIATEYSWYADVRKEGIPDPRLVVLPTAKTNLKYNGETQTGVAAGTGYTISGNTGKDAKSYTASVTLATGYKWADGSADKTRTIPWSIAKGTNKWTRNPSVTPPTWAEGSAPATITFANGANTFGAEVTCDTTETELKALTAGQSKTVTFTAAAGGNNYDAITFAVTVTVTGEEPPDPPEPVGEAWGWSNKVTVAGTDYLVVAFTNTAATLPWSIPANVTAIDYLVVGGGGAGGSSSDNNGGGGGGAGGVLEGHLAVTGGETVRVSVGAGGQGVASGRVQGASGTGSSLTIGSTVLSVLPGAGGSKGAFNGSGSADTCACGGGGGGGTTGQGNKTGGTGAVSNGGIGYNGAGGGGGGAGGDGVDSADGGTGGVGVATTIFDGTEQRIAGGGAGSPKDRGGNPSVDGGGAGGHRHASYGGADATSGTTWGAGGGGGKNASPSGSGHQGIVVIRYALGGVQPEPEPTRVALPTAAAGLKYNGREQTGVAEGEGYTITGNTGTDAKSYTASVTLADGYAWSDGTEAKTRTVAWSIAKGVNTWTANPSVSPTTWVEGSAPSTITFATGANAFGAAVTCDTDEAELKALAEGTKTVTFTAAANGDNYDAITHQVTVTVTAKVEPGPTPVTDEDWGYSNKVTVAGTDYMVVVFTNTAKEIKWPLPADVTKLDYLVVGGGASGGSSNNGYSGGGGGAGGVAEDSLTVVGGAEVTAIVGAGGAAVLGSAGEDGTGSSLAIGETVVASALPGAGGGGGASNGRGGSAYACGGGAGGGYASQGTKNGGEGTVSKGGDAEPQKGAGGGGAGGDGALGSAGGAGGDGVTTTIFDGEACPIAGGGCGSSYGNKGMTTAFGGGATATDAVRWGAGGGGAGGNGKCSGAGHQGVVVIRYALGGTPERPTVDPSTGKGVTVAAESAADAVAKVSVATPAGVKNPEYATYFKLVATPAGEGIWTVTAELNGDKVRPEIAGASDEAAFVVEEKQVTMRIANAKAGLYYGYKTSAELEGLAGSEPQGLVQANETGPLTLTPQKEGKVRFYWAVVAPTDK